MKIPSRLSQQSFERFRQTISNAADMGRTVEVTAAGLASTTLAARLRDAISSYRRNHWGDEVPRPEWCNLHVYTNLEGKVFIGTVPPKDPDMVSGDGIQLKSSSVLGGWTLDELKAVCLLISNGKVQGGITVPLISSTTISTLELDYNIAIESTSNASIIF